MAIATLQEGFCFIRTNFSPNPIIHINALKQLSPSADNEISLKNGIDISLKEFSNCPYYSNKEILFLLSGVSFIDPGDIEESIEKLVAEQCSTSFICLAALNHICEKISKLTDGSSHVPLNEENFFSIVQVISFNNRPKHIQKA